MAVIFDSADFKSSHKNQGILQDRQHHLGLGTGKVITGIKSEQSVNQSEVDMMLECLQ